MANLGSLERAVMDVVWDAGKAMRVRELLDRLNEQRDLAYTTVQTVAERLVKKGLLVRTPYRNAFRYAAAHSRDEHVTRLMLEALAVSTDRLPVLTRFAQSVEDEDAHALLDELTRRTGRRGPR
ncbi:MAG: BlaI/MecI/CopY family transcriptional regulator [Nonomuraea sp.]|nr:BlaI/MecI/CopY family transcriptional regulator [Nonomuraea sp.]NUP61835.1 BlaI/MecI/CopY family transcriptional regulator [Nonomuraea sp.]NUP77814.1 BlaI/MecI/CopY family transcriptional regulator [Nonomuraea sp.]NUT12122.1 BlaI/MecI/CopY family transcriptional regulator [Nonomuraea sp.]